MIPLLFVPVVAYLVYLRNKNKAGTFIGLLITPLITSISLGVAITGFASNPTLFSFILVLFVLFCLVGDTYNVIEPSHLLYGLIYFALAHILLILVALKTCTFSSFMSLIFVILLGIMGYLYMKFETDNPIMKKAIPVYMLLATLSLTFAVGVSSFWFVIGTLSFYVSDVILGTSLFWKTEDEKLHDYVWPFYASGIFAIAYSLHWNIF